MKVSTVEVDAYPRAFHRAKNLQEFIRLRDDAAVVFDPEKDAALAGVVGAFVYLLLSIPITILVAPLERAMMERIVENAAGMPPEFREYVGTYLGSAIQVVVGFGFMLVVGSMFSTIGGVIGALLFKKSLPPVSDMPTQAG